MLALLRWPALLVLVMFGLALLYRYGPSRKDAKWRWLTPGSMFAAFAWLAVSALFSLYLSKFTDYNATYGSLGAVIGLMMWIWLSVSVILVGAELNAEIEHQTARDTTTGRAKPLGARGAVMADTVGKAGAKSELADSREDWRPGPGFEPGVRGVAAPPRYQSATGPVPLFPARGTRRINKVKRVKRELVKRARNVMRAGLCSTFFGSRSAENPAARNFCRNSASL